MQYEFEGDALAIFGGMSATDGTYSVVVDGVETRYSANVSLEQDFVHEHVSCVSRRQK